MVFGAGGGGELFLRDSAFSAICPFLGIGVFPVVGLLPVHVSCLFAMLSSLRPLSSPFPGLVLSSFFLFLVAIPPSGCFHVAFLAISFVSRLLPHGGVCLVASSSFLAHAHASPHLRLVFLSFAC